MRVTLIFLHKGLRKAIYKVINPIQHVITLLSFYLNNVTCNNFRTTGVPYVSIAWGGQCILGKNLTIHNGLPGNPIGRPQRCVFAVTSNAKLSIGDNVGLSGTVFNCQLNIVIENNVTIGGGTCIYDSDFHSLNPEERISHKENVIRKPVKIEENAFIGAHSTILKGVTIGRNSVIGACSVVTKTIPPDEIWAGNPAVFIKKINM